MTRTAKQILDAVLGTSRGQFAYKGYMTREPLPDVIRPPSGPVCGLSRALRGDTENLTLPGKRLDEVIEETVRKAFLRNQGNRRAVARELGISRSTAQVWARRLGIPEP